MIALCFDYSNKFAYRFINKNFNNENNFIYLGY